MKKNLLLLYLMLLPFAAKADPVEIDGIYYNLITKGKIAEVTSNPNNYSGVIDIPESVTYEGTEYRVTAIGNNAFFCCWNLTSVTIPNSVTTIGSAAFYSCSNLLSIFIPNSITFIGQQAFFSCSSLVSVYISDLEAWCSISFEDNPLTYAHHLYLNGEEIQDLVIPNTVTSIGDYAFRSCSSLTSITFPSSLTAIGDYAFSDCSGLTSVSLPNSVTSINDGTFSFCSSLSSATIPNSVTSIGASAFSGCCCLTSMIIPSSVTSIGNFAFEDCSCLSSVTIPNSVTTIGFNSFSGCNSLTSVIIPNSVTRIGGYAFGNCGELTSVSIGSGVERIDSKAFASCPELTDVFCYAENVPSMKNGRVSCTDAFEESYIEYATLHVPEASIGKYNNVEPWKNFKSIVSIETGDIPDIPEPEKCAKPTISYNNGRLTFQSETEGAAFVSEITDEDIKKNYTSEVDLTITYTITVYAMKTGFDNSDVATATLCWIDQQPQMEGVGDAPTMLAQIPATPVLIQPHEGMLRIDGAPQGTDISIYNTNGQLVGSAKATAGTADISTPLCRDDIAIVKIGDKAVKVVVK